MFKKKATELSLLNLQCKVEHIEARLEDIKEIERRQWREKNSLVRVFIRRPGEPTQEVLLDDVLNAILDHLGVSFEPAGTQPQPRPRLVKKGGPEKSE